jgi:hypothetical protein
MTEWQGELAEFGAEGEARDKAGKWTKGGGSSSGHGFTTGVSKKGITIVHHPNGASAGHVIERGGKYDASATRNGTPFASTTHDTKEEAVAAIAAAHGSGPSPAPSNKHGFITGESKRGLTVVNHPGGGLAGYVDTQVTPGKHVATATPKGGGGESKRLGPFGTHSEAVDAIAAYHAKVGAAPVGRAPGRRGR